MPAAWNEGFRDLFGFAPPDDQHGCLQDIHWSMGGLGYFATYSLGSIIAAQLYAAIEKENESVNKEIANGDTTTVLNWLRKNIHPYGREYTSEQLCKKTTGEPLNSKYFIDYATKKYTGIYSL